ncbi:MAG: oxidoreductase, partial [Brevundimonas sp.]|nr:oxidoreductase [Brevundimonas sp.]
MRYRPFGYAGTAVSSLTLSLGHTALTRGFEAAQSLIYAGLEAGINSFRLETADPVLADVVGQALSHVDRKLVSVTLMLGTGDGRRGSQRDFSAEGMTHAMDRVLHVSGLGHIDLALLDEPEEHELAQSTLHA